MKYEKTPVKNNIKDASKAEVERILERKSTSSLIWFIVKRHKFGLMSTWAVIMTVLYVFPPLPDIVFTLVR